MGTMYKEGQTLTTRCGSPHYISPEMLSGKPYDPLTSDIWSCGVIFYGMVAGYMPFDEAKNSKIFQKVIKADYEMPEDLTKECEDFIKRILDVNPKTRMTLSEIKNHSIMPQL